jgi:hypothetical protein
VQQEQQQQQQQQQQAEGSELPAEGAVRTDGVSVCVSVCFIFVHLQGLVCVCV